MPPPVPKQNVSQFGVKGKSQEVIQVEKKKMGRPYSSGSEKSTTKRARMTEQDVEKLRYCCEKLGKTESEIIRLGIEKVYIEVSEKR